MQEWFAACIRHVRSLVGACNLAHLYHVVMQDRQYSSCSAPSCHFCHRRCVLTDPAPSDLTGALAASVFDSNLMSDCAQFETAAQALMSLSRRAPASLAPCFERMLVDSVLRKVLKEDADQGCGVLIAVLVGLDREKVPLSQKVQESVSKVSEGGGA